MALLVAFALGFVAVIAARWWQVNGFGDEPPFRTEDDRAWLAYWTERR